MKTNMAHIILYLYKPDWYHPYDELVELLQSDKVEQIEHYSSNNSHLKIILKQQTLSLMPGSSFK